MSEPAVLHWERVMHKNVRSKEGVDVGTIIADDEEALTIYKGSGREYRQGIQDAQDDG
jgi:F420-0:gamma-glutamyl ligase-like protein